jgi:hypothetical protein
MNVVSCYQKGIKHLSKIKDLHPPPFVQPMQGDQIGQNFAILATL